MWNNPSENYSHWNHCSDRINVEDALNVVQAVSESPNRTVAASYFMRRFGMFTAMQLYNLAAYDEVWDGDKERSPFRCEI